MPILGRATNSGRRVSGMAANSWNDVAFQVGFQCSPRKTLPSREEFMGSCREFQDLHDLGGSLDRPRIVEHGAVVHRLLGDLAEALAAHPDLAQPPRQAEGR